MHCATTKNNFKSPQKKHAEAKICKLDSKISQDISVRNRRIYIQQKWYWKTNETIHKAFIIIGLTIIKVYLLNE